MDRMTSKSIRRGPYGPARAFVVRSQDLVGAEANESLLVALERLAGEGFSQAPVFKGGRCVGMLEVFQVLRELLRRRDFRELIERQSVGGYVRPARYLDQDEWIDEQFDWLADEAALVGSDREILGLLTPSDVLRRVNDYTEAFSVFAELEASCRALLDLAFPFVAERDRLHDLFRRRSQKRDASEVLLPEKVDDLGFWHYWAVFTDDALFLRLEPHCHWTRKKFAEELDRARSVRNDVMHFRRQATPVEVERLRSLRAQLVEIEEGLSRSRDRQPT